MGKSLMRFVLEGVYLSLFSSFLRVPPKLRAATRGCCAFLYVEAQDQTHTVRRDGTRCTDPGSKYARVCAQSTLRWPRNRRWQPGISGRWIPEPGAALPEIKDQVSATLSSDTAAPFLLASVACLLFKGFSEYVSPCCCSSPHPWDHPLHFL